MPYVTINESIPFECHSLMSGDWNGFASPRFTRAQADTVAAWINAQDNESRMAYDAEGDAFLFWRDGDDDEPILIGDGFDFEGERLYAVGAWYWTWEATAVTPNPADVAASVERMKAEILADITAGTLPGTVRSFEELNAYVDANCYGGFCDDDCPWGVFDDDNPAELAQNAIDAWLKGGRA